MRTGRALIPSLTSGLWPATLALSVASLVGGCGGSDKDPGGDSCPADSTCLSDDNNYWSETDLTIPVVETVADDVGFEICWGDVSDDLQCHSVDPGEDIIKVTFLEFANKTRQEVIEILNSGVRPSVGAILTYETNGATCMNFTDFMTTGGEERTVEQLLATYKEGTSTFVVTFNASNTLGAGSKTMLFLEPSADSDNLEVNASTGCGDEPLLDYEVDIAGAEPLEIPMDGPWVVDWSNVQEDSVGNELPEGFIDRALLGFYEGQSVADIEEGIYDIETSGLLWELNFGSDTVSSADLADVTPAEGNDEEFDGFDRGEGTWLFALMCSTCSSPAPVVLTVLEPTSGAD